MAKKNDRLKDFYRWAIECYEVAASPPAVNYSGRVDASYRDDVNGYSRAYLLRTGIDAKYALQAILARIPRNRAAVLVGWLTTIEDSYYHNLTGKQQYWFLRDRKALKNRLTAK